MDILSIVGIVPALIAIIGGAILKGSSAGALVGSAAFVIVVVGTLAASLVQTPMATFESAHRRFGAGGGGARRAADRDNHRSNAGDRCARSRVGGFEQR
jgi:hypothetical protein